MAYSSLMRHPLLALCRFIWLGAELGFAAARYPFKVLVRQSGSLRSRLEAEWLKDHCTRVLRVLGVEVHVAGVLPEKGLIACNHLSYVDVLALGSLTPMIFVAKKEVRGWPVFGLLARFGGTVFVHRENRGDASKSSEKIREALDRGDLVTLFPEGTSSDGARVLPFKSSLLAAVCPGRHLIHAGSIHYSSEDGDAAEEICYWGGMTLLPHLLNLLGRPRIKILIGFSQIEWPGEDRKALAAMLHSEVQSLKWASEKVVYSMPQGSSR